MKKTDLSQKDARRLFDYVDDSLYAIAATDTGAKIDPKINIDNLEPIQCPCCRQMVKSPTLELVIDRFEISDQQALILKAVWDGRGFPVQTERIFDVMYADDPNGGPSPSKMYLAFKVGLHHLRQKLKGSGIGIENVGYRQGYRLVIGEE